MGAMSAFKAFLMFMTVLSTVLGNEFPATSAEESSIGSTTPGTSAAIASGEPLDMKENSELLVRNDTSMDSEYLCARMLMSGSVNFAEYAKVCSNYSANVELQKQNGTEYELTPTTSNEGETSTEAMQVNTTLPGMTMQTFEDYGTTELYSNVSDCLNLGNCETASVNGTGKKVAKDKEELKTGDILMLWGLVSVNLLGLFLMTYGPFLVIAYCCRRNVMNRGV